MENKRLIKFLAVAAFTISIQLVSVYATPDSNDRITSEIPTVNETSSLASVNYLEAMKD